VVQQWLAQAMALHVLFIPGQRLAWPLATQCLDSDDAACVSAATRGVATLRDAPFADTVARLRPTIDVPGTAQLVQSYGAVAAASGVRAADHLVADLQAEYGAERFARWWTDADTSAAAFARTFGEPETTWARRWLTRHLPPILERPSDFWRPALGMLLLIGSALGVALYANRR
jgi:hypothetical protein